MKKNNLVSIIACALVVAVIFGLVAIFSADLANNNVSAEEPVKYQVSIAHISDLHIVTEAVCNHASEKYLAKDATEAKYLAESTSSLKETLFEMLGTDGTRDEAKADAPLYLLISGDLTLNGERTGHVYLADLFGKVTEVMRKRQGYENFQILIIPGNHDIYNPGAATYMPTDEELAACKDDQARQEKMRSYKKSGSEYTVSSIEFMEIYADFGYGGEKMAQNISLEYFYQSEYWYDDVKDLVVADGTPFRDDPRLQTTYPTAEEAAACKDLGRAYAYYNRAVRHGSCSYIARTDDVTFVCIDGNSRTYQGDKKNIGTDGYSTALDWKETTGGEISDMQLRWIAKSLENDAKNEKLIVSQLHQNMVPHFEMEDQVLSLFTFDDYRRAINVFADAGVKYSFTGHMHASDFASAVSQNGNVLYDFETGSPIAYGASYRVTEFITRGSGANYSEDVTTKISNVNTKVQYQRVKVDDQGNAVFVDGKVQWETAETEIGQYAFFKDKLYNMIPTMVKSIVTESLFTDLQKTVEDKMKEKYPIVVDLANAILSNINDFAVYPFETDDKNLPKLGSKPKAGYNLVAFVNDFVDWMCDYDFSNGKVEGGYKMGQILMDVYGVHLAGTNPTSIENNVGLNIFMGKLQDGSFVNNLVKYLSELLLPQVDLLLNAPIRWRTTDAAIAKGEGFDITAVLSNKYSTISVSGVAQSLIKGFGFKSSVYVTEIDEDGDEIEVWDHDVLYYNETTGYTSIKGLLQTIIAHAQEILEMDAVQKLLEGFDIRKYLDKYYNKVVSYADKYFKAESLLSFANDKLISKYVTDAFCKNLGDYAYRILLSLATDDTSDGSKLVNGEIVNEPLKIAYYVDGVSVFGEHTYTKKTIEVTPSVDNGLLASNISISDVVKNGELSATSKQIVWRTKINADIFGSTAEYTYPVPKSYIKYATSAQGVATATPVEAVGKNANLDYPSIDLGIMFFNITHLYETYNLYSITLDGLTADTVYYYSLGNDEYGWSEVNSFRTVKDSTANGYTIMGITDIQGSVQKNYVESAPNLKIGVETVGSPDFILSGGDNVDNGKNISQWGWFLNDQRSIWASNGFVGTPGNHEDGYGELSGNVALPNQSTGKEYYSFFYVNTEYIVLDTNDLEKNQLSRTQYNWLISELKAASSNEKVKWIIVLMHKGPYTAGSHAFDDDVIALRAQLTSVFAEYGVDVVLEGHDHTYTVSNYLDKDAKAVKNKVDGRGAVVDSKGVLYINMGTMGDKFYDYLYSQDIEDVFVSRDKVSSELNKYLSDGKLELVETPVFLSINVTDDDLNIVSYAIVDGKTVVVDNILLSHQYKLSVGAIIGIVAGSVVGAALIGVGIFFLVRKKKK